jgi:hypothetical protein
MRTKSYNQFLACSPPPLRHSPTSFGEPPIKYSICISHSTFLQDQENQHHHNNTLTQVSPLSSLSHNHNMHDLLRGREKKQAPDQLLALRAFSIYDSPSAPHLSQMKLTSSSCTMPACILWHKDEQFCFWSQIHVSMQVLKQYLCSKSTLLDKESNISSLICAYLALHFIDSDCIYMLTYIAV